MHISYVGGLGKDSEIKMSKNGKQFLSFSAAVDEMVKGNKKTIWTNVTYIPNDPTNLAQYLKKGKRVFINGNLTCDLYTSKDGSVNISYNVLADSVEFVGGSSSGETNTNSVSEVKTTTATVTPSMMDCGSLSTPTPQPSLATTPSQVVEEVSDLPF